MERKIIGVSAAFNIASWVALITGIAVYMIGLWNAHMQLNDKGYYFSVLILGLFAATSMQKTVCDSTDDTPAANVYYFVCIIAFITSVVLLVVGLWNASLLISEKGFYGLAFFLGLFGAIAVQKSVWEADETETEEHNYFNEEPEKE